MWNPVKSYGSLCSPMGPRQPYPALWSTVEPSAGLWSHVEPYSALWTPIWKPVESFGDSAVLWIAP